MRTCMCVYVHVCACVHTCARTHVCMCARVYMCACVQACSCVCSCVVLRVRFLFFLFGEDRKKRTDGFGTTGCTDGSPRCSPIQENDDLTGSRENPGTPEACCRPARRFRDLIRLFR